MNRRLPCLAALFALLTLLSLSTVPAAEIGLVDSKETVRPQLSGSTCDSNAVAIVCTNGIKVGDSRDTVLSILGKPEGYVGTGNKQTFFYERYVVWFDAESGKVKGFRVKSDEELAAKQEMAEGTSSIRGEQVAGFEKDRPGEAVDGQRQRELTGTQSQREEVLVATLKRLIAEQNMARIAMREDQERQAVLQAILMNTRTFDAIISGSKTRQAEWELQQMQQNVQDIKQTLDRVKYGY